MSNNDQEIHVPALRRTAFLGMLYEGATGNLLNVNLFDDEDIVDAATVTTPMPRTEATFKMVNSLRERSELLSVSASVSLSILGGTVKLSGFGSYLDRSDAEEESRTITGMVRARTVHKRLILNDSQLQQSTAINQETLRRMGVTHVVTAITYGGTLLGNITETKAQRTANENIKGKFSLETLQSFGKLGKVKGHADFGSGEEDILNKLELSTSLEADYVGNGQPLPITAEEMIKRIQQGLPDFTSDVVPTGNGTHGVPVDLVLTPLSYFDQVSIELIFRELDETDLKRLQLFYDDLTSLVQSRNSLFLEVSQPPVGSAAGAKPYRSYFPTFYESCRQRHRSLINIHTQARTSLGMFLKNYRTEAAASETVEAFLTKNGKLYQDAKEQFEADVAHWDSLRRLKQTADTHKYPLTAVEDVSVAWSNASRVTVVLEIIPENFVFSRLLHKYRNLGKEIRVWREEEDKDRTISRYGISSNDESAAYKSIFLSHYAEPSTDGSLATIDNMKGSVLSALEAARESRSPQSLLFGFRPSRNGTDWINLDDGEEWGMMTYGTEAYSRTSKTRYCGYIKNKMPHGSGEMTYPGGVVYKGGWLGAMREGNGRIYHGAHLVHEGLFIGDSEDWNPPGGYHVAVEVRVVQPGGATETTTCVVYVSPGAAGVVSKLAEVFGWRKGERYRLTSSVDTIFASSSADSGSPPHLVNPAVVIANGDTVEVPPPVDGWTHWPDHTVQWEGQVYTFLTLTHKLRPYPDLEVHTPGAGPDQLAAPRMIRPIKIDAVRIPGPVEE